MKRLFKKVIQFLFITLIVILENITKTINTFKLIYIILKKDYKEAKYTVKNGKYNIIFEY